MTEGQFANRFEDEGVALARICPNLKNLGYILFSTQQMAQKIVRSRPGYTYSYQRFRLADLSSCIRDSDLSIDHYYNTNHYRIHENDINSSEK